MALSEYRKGLPCMLGEAVGRIVGESDKGSWGFVDDVRVFSIPLFCTPHGTIIETGVLYLSPINHEGMERLLAFEAEVKKGGGAVYAGRLE